MKQYGNVNVNKKPVLISDSNIYCEGGGKLLSDIIYPVGSIYISVVDVNPSEYFGGTWEAFGTGKCLIGVDTSQTEFNTVMKTGGSKTHYHQYGIQYSTLYGSPYGNDSRTIRTYNGLNGSWSTLSRNGTSSETGNNGVEERYGSTFNCAQYQSINNTTQVTSLQPYITVYMWRRVADASGSTMSQTI